MDLQDVSAARAAAALAGAGVAYSAFQLARLAAPSTDADLDVFSARNKPEYFRDKVCWITGASSGIGSALAVALAGLGVGTKLVLSARRKEALDKVVEALPDGTECKLVLLDQANLESLDAAGREALAAFGRVDVLFNNGGVSTRSFAESSSFHGIDERVTVVDYLAHVKITKLVLPGMIQRGSGHIVNTVSLAGKLWSPARTAYCGAKWAMMGYFDSLRVELARYNIHISNICPGSVRTDVARNALVGEGRALGVEDPNIASGMRVERCAALMLVAASNNILEAWFFGSQKEKVFTYLGVYMPHTMKRLTVRFADKLMAPFKELAAKGGAPES